MADPNTLRLEKSKVLHHATSECQDIVDENWDKMDTSQQGYYIAHSLQDANLLIEQARNQDRKVGDGEKQEISFTNEEIAAVKKLNKDLRDLLLSHGYDAERLKGELASTDDSIATIIKNRVMLEKSVKIPKDDMKVVLSEVTPIILSINETGNHLGSLRVGSGKLNSLISLKENYLRNLKNQGFSSSR